MRMSLPEKLSPLHIKGTSSNPSASKSRTPKAVVVYKSNDISRSNIDLKPAIKTKNEVIILFLEDLLGNIIASRENTSSKDLTDSDEVALPYEDFFPTSAHLELEGESKRSLISSGKASRLSGTGSEKNLDKIMHHERESTDDPKITVTKKSSSCVVYDKQVLDQIKSEFTTEDGESWTKYMRINFVTGNTYEGEMEDCLMHGHGVYTWSNGTVYEGEFRKGYPTGKGKIVLSELSVYTGDFCMGYFHGNGVLNVYATSMIYKGQWKNGKRDGEGWISYGVDNWYDGDWVNDMKHGNGTRSYEKGVKYKGQWMCNWKNGNGSMLWNNNDHYQGQWQHNKQNGYGEYIWNLSLNKSFTFLVYNSYKGAWVNGKRSGIGMMHFGLDNGSKLVGMWQNDFKDGPGILSSGNGELIACDPLFEYDKPVHKEVVELLRKRDKSVGSHVSLTSPKKNLFRTVVNLIKKKEPVYYFSEDILEELKNYSSKIMSRFETVTDYLQKRYVWCPLKISINAVTEAVNLKYYVAEIKQHFQKVFASKPLKQRSAHSECVAFRVQEVSEKTLYEEEDYNNQLKIEEQLLKNFITISLSRLKEIYTLYAKLSNPESKTKPILIRLFLWQLLRDIQIFYRFSLVEADSYFGTNPWSCTESDYNPFEEIYFWQFVQFLVGCSWLFFKKSDDHSDVPKLGMVTHIFRKFLEKEVYPNYGKVDGTALREHKDILSIKAVHQLYCSLGEPHTVRTFLNHTCTKNKKEPPCYFGRYVDDSGLQIFDGYNAVSVGDNISFIITKTSKQLTDLPSERDIFRKTLFAFRSLGKNRIIKCITTVYPNLKIDRRSVDFNYHINFLEFYEIILLCAIEKVQILKKAEEVKKMEEKKSIATTDIHLSSTNSKLLKRDMFRKKKLKSFVS